MASSPQGPGWWQASDGQWYAPEQHPDYRPPQRQYPQQPAPQQSYPPPTQPAYPQPQPQYPYQQPGYGQPSPSQPPYGQPSYGQPASGQPPVGQPPVGQPPYQQPAPGPAAAPKKSSGRNVLVLVAVLLVLGLVVGIAVVLSDDGSGSSAAADGEILVGAQSEDSGKTDEPDKSIKEDAPDTGVSIEGAENTPEDAVVASAIADIQAFWTDEMPKVYGVQYLPVKGGFYSWSPDEPLPPCADDPSNIEGNAFYCGNADDVAWDDADLIPSLYERFGDLSVAIVFAHEWGHAIQVRADMRGQTVTLEQQADCFAGAWVSHVRDGGSEYFTADGPALDRALGGFIEIADTPGTSAQDENAHGSAFDRINAFKDGLDGGAGACRDYTDQSVQSRLVEFEFTDQEDFDRNGNARYEDILRFSTDDLEDYWSKVAEQTFDTTWTPLGAAKPFDGTRSSSSPSCGDADTSGYTLFYCAPERFIAYDDVGLFPQLYDQLGDFAVGALYGTQYSLAAQDQFGIAPDSEKQQNLMADCMTGSWAASVFLEDRDSASLQLSPGDLDEAVKMLLALGSTEDDGGTVGTGFERVSAFRDGVVSGIGACSADG